MSTAGDVVIVGGGAVGLSAAWYLQREGLRVTVVSREPIGVGASAGNAGMIVPSHVVPLSAPGVIAQGLRWLADPRSPFHVRIRPDPELVRWLWRFRSHCTPSHVSHASPILRDLSLASVRHFEAIAGETGDFGWDRSGLLMLFRTPKGRRSTLQDAEVAEGLGLRVRSLDAAGVQRAEPRLRSEATGGILYEDDARIDPEAFLARLAEAIRDKGGSILENVTVHGIGKRSGGLTTVETDQGHIRTDTVVVAAGAWGGAIGPRRLPVQPAKGYSITVPVSGDGPGIPMILSEDKVTVTPLPGRIRFGGTLSLSGFDGSVDGRRVEPIRREAARYRPDLSPEEIARLPVWAGFRPASPDGLPIVGRLHGRPDLVVATGHGMMGITLAPVTGRIVADLVTGRPGELDPEPLSPDRFGVRRRRRTSTR